jgi:hypothetical protein
MPTPVTLTSPNQLGGQVGDEFGNKVIIHVFADGVYGFAEAPFEEFIIPLGAQFLLDPNEINAIGELGPTDQTMSRDVGNVGATNWSRLSGGFVFPWDVKIKGLYVEHYETNNNALPWGWVLAYFKRVADSTAALPVTYVLDEVAANGGVGPRDHNSTNQITDVVDIPAANNIVPAKHTLSIGVAAPTANNNNYYVRAMSGHILCQRV